MAKIDRLIDQIPAGRRASWEVDGGAIDVAVLGGRRVQRVVIDREGDGFVFTSVVLGRRAVSKDGERWRELATMAWERNAQSQLVTFAFDHDNRLVGEVRHPADCLDAIELETYVNTLAVECDRFEYLLTGRDTF